MNQLVLVRELKNNLSAEELQDITTTQTGGARMGSSEQAQSDAAKILADTIALYPQDENADITHAAAKALADEFGKIANQLVDQNGQKIFRYNRRTKNIELTDGRSLEAKKDVSDGELGVVGKVK